eukprot:TRINITY_DN8167_c0_g1_i1.p3 TRINITY_DN8167_c0_g1~~TRINITY_DN8167_c0_g1_i1.p3  ORF type:complete len:101 (-),score=8.49 TRINITY_DN8167_c0_g1_i1:329-631(-)
MLQLKISAKIILYINQTNNLIKHKPNKQIIKQNQTTDLQTPSLQKYFQKIQSNNIIRSEQNCAKTISGKLQKQKQKTVYKVHDPSQNFDKIIVQILIKFT